MESLSNYLSAAILLMVSIGMVTLFIDTINHVNNSLLKSKLVVSGPCFDYVEFNHSKIFVINKFSNPYIIGNYTVIENNTNTLIIQTNQTIKIFCNGEIYEEK